MKVFKILNLQVYNILWNLNTCKFDILNTHKFDILKHSSIAVLKYKNLNTSEFGIFNLFKTYNFYILNIQEFKNLNTCKTDWLTTGTLRFSHWRSFWRVRGNFSENDLSFDRLWVMFCC